MFCVSKEIWLNLLQELEPFQCIITPSISATLIHNQLLGRTNSVAFRDPQSIPVTIAKLNSSYI